MTAPDAPVLEARDLHRTYQVSRGMFAPTADVKAVAGISFSVRPGKTLAVVGESGSGKSTLGRMLTLIETPTDGRLAIDGIDVTGSTGATLKALRRKVQMVFQNPYGSLNPRQTIADTLEEPLLVNGMGGSADERRAAALDMLERVGLRREHARRYPHMFSGGQR
ncbi:dipeptide ABC transporter ATP-binding protein, partial [Prosthecomicrobium hirschii]